MCPKQYDGSNRRHGGDNCCEQLAILQTSHNIIASKVWIGLGILFFITIVIIPFLGWTANQIVVMKGDLAKTAYTTIEVQKSIFGTLSDMKSHLKANTKEIKYAKKEIYKLNILLSERATKK